MRRLQLNDNGDIEASYERKLIGGLNRWYNFDNNYLKVPVSGVTSTANIIRYYHLKVPRPVQINGAAIAISTSVTGNFRFGLYENIVIDNAFTPGNLILDFGEQPTSGTGFKTFPISTLDLPDGDYFGATVSSANTGYNGFVNSSTMGDIFGVSTPSNNAVASFTQSFTYGELPSVAAPSGEDTRYPSILFRVVGFL